VGFSCGESDSRIRQSVSVLPAAVAPPFEDRVDDVDEDDDEEDEAGMANLRGRPLGRFSMILFFFFMLVLPFTRSAPRPHNTTKTRLQIIPPMSYGGDAGAGATK
jgi:hypothetical protein